MPHSVLKSTFLLILGVAVVAQAGDTEDAAKRAVLGNIARQGYEAANAGYEVGTAGVDEVLLWSCRWLDAELDMTGFDMREGAEIEKHLKRVKELRREANVEDQLNASEVDFHYQVANALRAKASATWYNRWRSDIVELSRLQGTWKEDLRQRRGQGPHRDEITLEIVGGIARLRWRGLVTGGFITIWSTSSPKAIDIRGRNTDYFTNFVGIYGLTDDTLRISWTEDESKTPRPSHFRADQVTDPAVYTLTRQKRIANTGQRQCAVAEAPASPRKGGND